MFTGIRLDNFHRLSILQGARKGIFTLVIGDGRAGHKGDQRSVAQRDGYGQRLIQTFCFFQLHCDVMECQCLYPYSVSVLNLDSVSSHV